MMTVLLDNDTVCSVDYAEIGDMVTAKLHDENGIEIEGYGEVIEILEDDN